MAQSIPTETNTPVQIIGFQPVLWIIYSGFLLSLIFQGWYIFSLTLDESLKHEVVQGLLVSCLILFALVLLDLYQRKNIQHYHRYTPWVWLTIRVLLIELYGFSQQSLSVQSSLYLIIPFIAYPYLGKRTCQWILALISGRVILGFLLEFWWFIATPQMQDRADLIFSVIIYLVMAGLVGALIEAVDGEKKQRLQSEYLLDELQSLHAQMVDLAATEERNRLARDIHDSLGHYLTVIIIQLEKALTLQEKSPSVSIQAIQTANRLTREALQDVRQSVSSLRTLSPAVHLEDRLRKLIKETESAQLSIQLSVMGSQAGYSEHSLMTLYRVTQEAFSNILKHTSASKVDVTLHFTLLEATLKIKDNGQGFDALLPTTGFGLLGIRERLERIGGTLMIRSTADEGTCLSINIPQNPIQLQRLNLGKK